MSTDAARRLARVFDRAAADYENVGVPYFDVFGERLVALVDPERGARVLDVACGRGACLWPAARAAGPDGRVLGLDLAPAMVAATARDVAGACATVGPDLAPIAVVLADAEQPPVAGGAFDVVLAGMAVFFLTDPAAGLRHWRSTLRSGGRLALTTFAGEDRRYEALAEVFDDHAESADPRPGRSPGDKPWHSDAGMTALLTSSGLADVQHRTESHVAVFPDASTFVRWTRSHGQLAAWDRIPAARTDDASAALIDALAPLREPCGALRYRVDVRYTTTRSGRSGVQLAP